MEKLSQKWVLPRLHLSASAGQSFALTGLGAVSQWVVLAGILRPLGLALALGTAEGRFGFLALGAALGCLLAEGQPLALARVCALSAAVALRWARPGVFWGAAVPAGCVQTGMLWLLYLSGAVPLGRVLLALPELVLSVALGRLIQQYRAPAAPAAAVSPPVQAVPVPAQDDAPLTARLEAAVAALTDVAETVRQVYAALPRKGETYEWVVQRTHDQVCAGCTRRETCWLADYGDTVDGLFALKPFLEQQGRVELHQLPGTFCRCVHPSALCAAVGRSWVEYGARRRARLQASAMRQSVAEQYEALAAALAGLAQQAVPSPAEKVVPRLRACFGQAGCPADAVSGDVVRQKCTGTRAEMLLCDGMGTGRPAAVDGTLAADLTGRLLAAGFLPDTAARLTNLALALKSEEDSGATLDLLQVDLCTGVTQLYKAGAAPGFVVQGGKARLLEASGLPVGLLPRVESRSLTLQLAAGDWAVLVSDGLLADGTDWALALVERCAVQGLTPEAAAGALVDAARARQSGRPDDITAAVLQLEPAG